MTNFNVNTISGDNKSKSMLPFFGEPNVCPICHHGVKMIQLGEGAMRHFDIVGGGQLFRVQLVFRCPLFDCASLFFGNYRRVQDAGGHINYRYESAYPMTPQAPIFPDGVAEISPNHLKIFTQAVKAEADGLDEIAGIGYRKSLEFLVKDYCIKNNPGKDAEIKKQQLGPVIQNFVSDPNIKECARMATWLGNDETHYERVWTGHDISDLKLLIRLTQGWISNAFLTEKYRAQIQKGNEPKKTP